MNGILNINKPTGLTSFGVVAFVRKCVGERRVGHAGTLDPNASGVLPVCLGQGTRVVEYLMDSVKTYEAEILLGVCTDTYDAEGRITGQADSSGITLAQIQSLLPEFRGRITQKPPVYSALKYQGKSMYKWAREGIAVETRSRDVTVHELELVDFDVPVLKLRIVCSKGTYIRSLAYDLGERLGCGGSLQSLVRTCYGSFEIQNSVTLDEVKTAFANGRGDELLLPLDYVLSHLSAMVLSEDDTRRVICGNTISGSKFVAGTGSPPVKSSAWQTPDYLCRAYSAGGCFLSVLRYLPIEDCWQPEKVFL